MLVDAAPPLRKHPLPHQTPQQYNTMEEQRQHLDHDELKPEAQSSLRNLCEAVESMSEHGWVEGVTMDTLNEEKLGSLVPAIKSLVQSCKVLPPPYFTPLNFSQS